ncbi:MAG: hypothetical protein ACFFBS_09995 [Promethearchaeota archaeon]
MRTTLSVPADTIPDGTYDLYFSIADGDGGRSEINVGTTTINLVSRPLLLLVVLVGSVAVISAVLILKRRH